MNILQACRDPNVFGAAFRNPKTWQAWFAFLAALFGLPLTAGHLHIYQQCTGRNEPPTERTREAWLVCGRRAGKSFTLALIAVFLACFFDWRLYLNIGERGTVMVIAADRKQARVIMRYVKGLLRLVPMLKQLIRAERQEAVDLSNRITIEVHTASFRTTRGYTVVAALLDELAFWQGEDSSNPDFEVINAITPAMATVPDAMLLCASSPYARKGALWEAYHKHFGKEGAVLVWKAATWEMNPAVPQHVIDSAFEKDPIAAQAEYGAEFRTDIESFVSREAVEACVEWSAHERPYIAGLSYVAFVDVSGGGADSFALAVAHKIEETAVLDLVREVKPPLSPEGVIAEFADTLRRYGIRKVVGDRYGGEFPREQFRKHGISYEPSADPKGALYLGLLPLLNSGKLRLLANQRLISQLLSLERNTSRGGRDNIDHGRGGHDDVANAAAGALVLALARKPKAMIGAIGVDGRITWKDDEETRPRLRIQNVSEAEALRQKAEGTW